MVKMLKKIILFIVVLGLDSSTARSEYCEDQIKAECIGNFTDISQLKTSLQLSSNPLEKTTFLLYNSNISYWSLPICEHYFPNLQNLGLAEGNTKTISSDAFRGCHAVTQLVLFNCGIEKIEPGAFEPLKMVKVLSVRGNKLKTFNAELLHGLENLSDLLLYENNIFEIDIKGLKQSAPKLVSVYLNANYLLCDRLMAILKRMTENITFTHLTPEGSSKSEYTKMGDWYCLTKEQWITNFNVLDAVTKGEICQEITRVDNLELAFACSFITQEKLGRTQDQLTQTQAQLADLQNKFNTLLLQFGQSDEGSDDEEDCTPSHSISTGSIKCSSKLRN